MGNRHVYNSGIVGNCNFIAYIDDMANVNWMCLPRFDSSFIFGSLLDQNKGGNFSIKPSDIQDYQNRQYYMVNTNILVTEFSNGIDAFRVIDFAPRFELYGRYFKPLTLMRKVEWISGKPNICVECSPKYDYGNRNLEVVQGSNHIDFIGTPNLLRLTTNAPLNYLLNKKNFFLTKNLYFALTYGASLEAPLEETLQDFLIKTIHYWRTWIRRTSIPLMFQSEAIRSSLVLKLHQYEDTGAIIASATTSLPEHDGSGRNWDYRFCWPRDTYYTLKAFNLISHFSEMEEYSHFIQNLISHEHHLQPVYGIDGSENLEEVILDLEGYRGNKPVRIGNQAYKQVQFDIYGQILLSILPLYLDERLAYKTTEMPEGLIEYLVSKIESSIDLPDAGIWEFRNCKDHHVHTQLFHWIGAKVAAKIATQQGNSHLVKKAQQLMSKAQVYIEKSYDPVRKCYKASMESDYLDASTLMLVNFNYLDPTGQRAKDHVDGIFKELESDNGFLYRYKKEDDFGETKSSFLVCAFWYIEALAHTGRINEAKVMLQKVIQSSNHLGLFSEDVSGPELSQWGNFPQTYSHVGLINCVYKLDRKLDMQVFD